MEPGWRYLPLSEYDYVSFFPFFFFFLSETPLISPASLGTAFLRQTSLEVIWEEIFLSSDMSG